MSSPPSASSPSSSPTHPITEEELALLKKTLAPHGKLLFAMVCGSAAFNLNIATSDRDLFGVYQRHALTGPFSSSPTSLDSHDPDYAVYEVAKFAEIVLKGNPKIVEPLYATHFTWTTPQWDEGLSTFRAHVLNRFTLKQYQSYAYQKVKSVQEGHKNPQKEMYHALRLEMEASRIAKGLDPMVYWEGAEREQIMAVRRGDIAIEDVVAKTVQMHQETKDMENSLPEVMSKGALNEWVWKLRSDAMVAEKYIQPLEDTTGLSHAPLEALLKENDREGTIVFYSPYGRDLLLAANGVSTTESLAPTDFFGVFVSSTQEREMALDAPPAIISSGESKGRFQRGLHLIEFEEFIRLILKGHHVYTEALVAASELPSSESVSSVSLLESAKMSPMFRKFIEQSPVPLPVSFLSKAHSFHYLGVSEGLLKARGADDLTKVKNYQIALKSVEQAKKISAGDMPTLQFQSKSIAEAIFTAPQSLGAEETLAIAQPSSPQINLLLQEIKNLKKNVDKTHGVDPAVTPYLNQFFLRLRRSFL